MVLFQWLKAHLQEGSQTYGPPYSLMYTSYLYLEQCLLCLFCCCNNEVLSMLKVWIIDNEDVLSWVVLGLQKHNIRKHTFNAFIIRPKDLFLFVYCNRPSRPWKMPLTLDLLKTFFTKQKNNITDGHLSGKHIIFTIICLFIRKT